MASSIGPQKSRPCVVRLRSEIIQNTGEKKLAGFEENSTNQVQYQDAQLRDSSEALEPAAVGQLAEQPARQPNQDDPLDPVQHD